MVLKDNTRPERNLKVAFADSLTGPYSPASQPFTESFVEGPSVEKVGEDYLVYFDVYRKKYTEPYVPGILLTLPMKPET